jgi:hypothetical protein
VELLALRQQLESPGTAGDAEGERGE